MNERIQKVKQHLSDHKTVYIVGASCLVVGVVGTILTTRTVTLIDGDLTMKIDQTGLRNSVVPTTINLIERSTPSIPVHLEGTNLYFSSLNEAARETGHSLSMISRNVNGHIDDVKGDVFKLLEPAA